MYYTIYKSPLGAIALIGSEKGLCMVSFQDGKKPLPIASDWIAYAKPFKHAIDILDHYFQGLNPDFDLSYTLQGTPFQLTVWHFLQTIAYGTTASYAKVAAGIGKPTAVRAVANAIGQNPVALFIPCHRVIGSNGSLTGYAGGLQLKAQLLQLERTRHETSYYLKKKD